MTEEQKPNGTLESQPMFALVSQFARDVSFETPQGPLALKNAEKDLNLEISMGMRPVGENRHEVALRLKGVANGAEQQLYVAEVEYVGIYHIENVQQDRLTQLLAIDGAAIIFPFARQVMMTAIEFGGFRAPLIEPVNFASLYMQAQQRQEKQPQQASA